MSSITALRTAFESSSKHFTNSIRNNFQSEYLILDSEELDGYIFNAMLNKIGLNQYSKNLNTFRVAYIPEMGDDTSVEMQYKINEKTIETVWDEYMVYSNDDYSNFVSKFLNLIEHEFDKKTYNYFSRRLLI